MLFRSGEDESAKLVTINDPNDPKSPDISLGNYDVTITTGASYTTRRVEAAQAMMDAVQVFPQMMQIAGDLVAKAQDWPGSEELAERLKKTVPPELLSEKEKEDMGPAQPNMQNIMEQSQQMQQTIQEGMQKLQELQAENATLKAKHDIDSKKLLIEEYKAVTDRMTAYANIEKAGADAQLAELEQHASMLMETVNMSEEADQQDHSQQMAEEQSEQAAKAQQTTATDSPA